MLHRLKNLYIAPALYGRTHRRWPSGLPRHLQPGYTLVLTVPPDVPAFLHLALDVCSRQDLAGLVETLVVPDHRASGFPRVFEAAAQLWTRSPIELVEIPPLDSLLRARTRNTSLIHWLQIVAACRRARSTHILLHDADLVLTDPSFFRRRYEACREGGLACLAVSRREDIALGVDASSGRPLPGEAPPFPELAHLVSTWELMLDVSWARSFTPAQLRPQYATIRGLMQHLDTLHFAQSLTDPSLVGCQPPGEEMLHFGATLTQYRAFQRMKSPFPDRLFRLLLIQLISSAYNPDQSPSDIPSLDVLPRGLSDASARVTYTNDTEGRRSYSRFRKDLERLTSAGYLNGANLFSLSPFDEAYGCDPDGQERLA